MVLANNNKEITLEKIESEEVINHNRWEGAGQGIGACPNKTSNHRTKDQRLLLLVEIWLDSWPELYKPMPQLFKIP